MWEGAITFKRYDSPQGQKVCIYFSNKKFTLKINCQNVQFLTYYLNFSLNHMLNRISLVPSNSSGPQLLFDVLYVKMHLYPQRYQPKCETKANLAKFTVVYP